MKQKGKRKRVRSAVFVIFLPLLIFLLYELAIYAVTRIQNVQGYCTRVGADLVGVKLTDSQRLKIAVSDYLTRQLVIGLMEVQALEKYGLVSLTALERQIEIIPYMSTEEFFNNNQNCCEIVFGLVEGAQFGIRQRAAGVGNGMFEFRHKIRFIDEAGQRKIIESRDTYYKVDNCGNARSIYYL